MSVANNLKDDLFSTLETMHAMQESDGISYAYYNDLIKTLAVAAVKSGMNEMNFYEDVDEIIPYVYSEELVDDETSTSKPRNTDDIAQLGTFLHIVKKLLLLFDEILNSQNFEFAAVAKDIKERFYD